MAQRKKRADGRYSDYIVERGRDGRLRRRYVYGRTNKEVDAKLADLQVQAGQGTLPEPGKLTCGDYLDKWLEYKRTIVDLRTWVRYEQIVRLQLKPHLGKVSLKKVTPLDFQQMYTLFLTGDRPLSRRSVNHIHSVARNAFRQAVRWRLIARCPVDDAEPPRAGKPLHRILTAEQVQTVLREFQAERLGTLHLAAVLTALREGELFGLRWADIDFEAGQALVSQTVWWHEGQPQFKPWPKNQEARTTPIPAELIPWLRAHQDRQGFERRRAGAGWHEHGLVFCQLDGQPLRHYHALDSLRRALRRAGLPPMRFHDLRHSAISLLIGLGASLKDVSEYAGHSSVSITGDIYAHLLPGARHQMARKLTQAIFEPDPPAGRRRKGRS